MSVRCSFELCTWCHCLPICAPPRLCSKTSSFEEDADAVGSAHDHRRQGRPDESALKDGRPVQGGAARLSHQRRPVAVFDRHMVAVAVEVTKYRVKVNVKGSEF